jgi:hypothetical protein
VGVDDEDLYIDVGPQQALAQQPQPPAQHSSSDDDNSNEEYEVNDDDDDDTVVDPNEMVENRGLEPMPDQFYDKKDPPMTVGTVY